MIDVRNRSECFGCTACVSVCPVQCIVMRRDREEGFDYPVANPDICIGCGKCEDVCPVINPLEESLPQMSYAARDKERLMESSSGGVFPKLAESVVAAGGIVYGAAFDSDFSVGHVSAETIEELDYLKGSKYVQSDLFSTYDDIREELEDGRDVLFSGTPCQVAGLHKALGKSYEGLLTVDCACHGVPGPGLWGMYVKELAKRNGGRLSEIRFRDKSGSWYHYDFVVNGKKMPYMKDPYMALFVQNMTLRPSCYACPARRGRSGSDLTLADLWNAAYVAPEMNDDKGVSLVCVNTDKGRWAFDNVKSGLEFRQICHEEAIRNNGGFAESITIPDKRDEFFRGLDRTRDVYGYMKGFVVHPPLPARILLNIRHLLVKFKKSVFS